MIDAHAYNIMVRKGNFGGEVCYEARVRELPDIAEYGDTFQQAYELAVDAIETTAEIMTEKRRKMPQPQITEDTYSGRVTLRIPRTLHRSLAERAEDEGVSLNHLIVCVLSMFRGFGAAVGRDRDAWIDAPKEETVKGTAPTFNANLD